MSDALHFSSLLDIAAGIRHGKFSSVEVTQYMLQRIDAADDRLQSYATVMPEHALAAAQQADEKQAAGRLVGMLHGVPLAVKDLCYTCGVRTMGGSAVLADNVPDYDATVVRCLAAAGAVLLGKLNLTEGAMSRYHPDFGVPQNPWNPDVWAGSSSSGSGVAAAAGLAFGTLGSDTGGSIRFPAAACGVVGLKPTWGRVSRYGVLPLAESLDHVGPITRYVADAAAMLQVIAGPDPDDPTALHAPVPDMLVEIDAGVAGVRIGLDEAYLTQYSEPVVSAAVLAAVSHLESLGAEIVPVQLPDFDEFVPAWITLCSAEAVLSHESTYPARRDDYGPGFRQWLDWGAEVSGVAYARANRLRATCNGLLQGVFQEIDLLACPSMPEPPQLQTPETIYAARTRFDSERQRFTAPFDFNGAPTLSLPCGFTEDGLPLSLQLVGHHLAEALLCRVGQAYEATTEWHRRRPPLAATLA